MDYLDMSAGYSYDSAGNLHALAYGNGASNTYSYDTVNRLTNQVWQTCGVTLVNFGYR